MIDSARTALMAIAALMVPAVLVGHGLTSAQARLDELSAKPSDIPIAASAEDAYCTPHLKAIIRRVATACGLIEGGGGSRGCQPVQAQKVAQLSDEEFNALFLPLEKRASLIQFDADQVELDEAGKSAVEKAWSEQRGASFFFVVSRASADGGVQHNEELSKQRAEAVLTHLEQRFDDPDLKKEVGLMWLGESFAQLGDPFCAWTRSRADECTEKEINRSAFVAWIDCSI